MSSMTSDEIKRVLDDYHAAKQTAAGASDELFKEFKRAQRQIKDEAQRAEQSTKNLTRSVMDYFSEMSRGRQGQSEFNDILDKSGSVVSSVLSNFGMFGKILGKLTEGAAVAVRKVNEQSDALYDTFTQMGKIGATTSEGMSGIFKDMQKLGYGIGELGEMTALLAENSATLAKLGGSVGRGVNTLANISDTIIHSEIGYELMKMGKSVDEINRYAADVTRQQILMGGSRRDQLHFLAQETAEYAYQMDALARLTGMTREQQRDAIEKAFADEAFNQQMAEWNAEAERGDAQAQAQINKWREIMTSNLPEATKKELSRSIAGDYGAAQQSILAMPDAVNAARDKNATAAQVINRARDQLKTTQQTMGALAKYHAYSDTFGNFKEQHDFLASIGDENYEDLRDKARAQQATTDTATNAQTKLRVNQMNTRDAMQSLINLGITPVTQAFTALAQSSAWLAKVPGAYVPAVATRGAQEIGKGAVGESVKASGPNAIAAIVETGPGYLIVKRPDGSVQKLEGARNWRNNNPGNLEYGELAKKYGAIGSDGRFAIFPSLEAGQKAQGALLFTGKNYRGLTLTQAIARYAPPNENNTAQYQRIVLQAAGGVDKPMSEYSESEQQAIMSAMHKVEGFRAGKVTTISGETVTTDTGKQMAGDFKALTGKNLTGVNSSLSNALAGAAAEYQKITGKTITVTSAIRDPQKQQELYNDYLAGRSKYPVAKPGHSKHDRGMAIDINSADAEALSRMGLLTKYGLARPVANDPVHIELAKYATGGVSSGPTSGYEVLLHGTEAVVPVTKNQRVPIHAPRNSNQYDQLAARTEMMQRYLKKLSEVVELAQDSRNVEEKIHRHKRV